MRTHRVFVVLIAVFFTLTPAAHAESARWSIRFHGGGAIVPAADSGTVTLPPPAAPVALIPTGPGTRPVPSWFFGDGVTRMRTAMTRPGRQHLHGGVAGEPVYFRF